MVVLSLRLLAEALLVPVHRLLRAFGLGGRESERYEPVAAQPAVDEPL